MNIEFITYVIALIHEGSKNSIVSCLWTFSGSTMIFFTFLVFYLNCIIDVWGCCAIFQLDMYAFLQVNKMVEGCRKRKTHSPVRLTPGEKKMRVGKNSMSSCGTATTPSMNEADEQQSRMISQHTFDYR